MRRGVTGAGIVFVLTVVMLAVLDKPSFSAESQERETLRGVEAFDLFVRIRAGDAGARKLGITQERLRRDLEERLRKAGIKVLKDANPYLLLSVSIISISHPTVDGILAYLSSEQLKFRQGAVLDANGGRATVTTWDEIRFGARSPTKYLDRQIMQSIDTLVDGFVKDYLAANANASDTTPQSRSAPRR